MSNIQVKIVRGMHRGEAVNGTFQVIKAFVDKGHGIGEITVLAPPGCTWNKSPTPRIKVHAGDITLIGPDGAELPNNTMISTTTGDVNMMSYTAPAYVPAVDFEVAFMDSESEDDAMARISDTFSMLDKITDACAKGTVRGLVVSGPPGIGKSFGVEKQLDSANMFRTIKGQSPNYEIISGGVSSIGLYQKLYHNRGAEKVIVFDDADSIFTTEESLNLLKAALNSGEKRRICWNKESRVLADGDIPEAFDFEGSVIFLSNIDFEKSIAKGSRIADHLAALMSRCHYLDLRVGSMRDKLLRIKQIIRDGMLKSYSFTPAQEHSIIEFVTNNTEHMREVSLRAVKKLADLVKMDSDDWYTTAEATLLHREALFKRLYDARQQQLVGMGCIAA